MEKQLTQMNSGGSGNERMTFDVVPILRAFEVFIQKMSDQNLKDLFQIQLNAMKERMSGRVTKDELLELSAFQKKLQKLDQK